MSALRGSRTGAAGACLLLLLGAAGCGKEATKAPAPAKVEGAGPEAELATITLTPEAEKRLGITVAAIERRAVADARVLGGQVDVPPGRAVSVSAPIAGTLLPPAGTPAIAAGSRVRQGQTLFRDRCPPRTATCNASGPARKPPRPGSAWRRTG